MLLKMNKPPQFARQLDLVNQYLITIMVYFEGKVKFDKEEFKLMFPEEAQCLLQTGFNPGLWLTKLFDDTTSEERRQIVNALRNDRFSSPHHSNPNYCFDVRNMSQELRDKVKKHFERFYGDIFYANGLGQAEVFYKEYEKVNPDRFYLCPACLEVLDADEGLAQLDHYFPKQHYPTLGIHLDNIQPLCLKCNSLAVKSNRLPTDPDGEWDEDHNLAGCLQTVYLPYHHPCDGLDEMDVRFDGTAGNRTVQIQALEPANSVRVRNFKKLFNLDGRWKTLIDRQVEKALETDLLTELMPVYIENKMFNPDTVHAILLREIEKERAKSKQSSGNFLKWRYLEWRLAGGFESLCEYLETHLENRVRLESRS